jgi:hypothetical protein
MRTDEDVVAQPTEVKDSHQLVEVRHRISLIARFARSPLCGWGYPHSPRLRRADRHRLDVFLTDSVHVDQVG